MAKKYIIDKEKCVGCGVCVAVSSGGTELGTDGKAEITDSEKIEKSGGEEVCPYGAVKEDKSAK
ncbi:MAG: ferredoxin [Candidatus Paceibacterota bacterium]|nr:ferredoxin [Candidatus Paceibacterota bacterium]MDD4830706.1 ferredoxin [Candidatus Paceibacterota bacterium]MDD4875145.1 ferredoxin [Candidatus Paceibacterota bacterium]